MAPILTEVVPEGPTVLKAAWRPPPDIKEEIIAYMVCYRDTSSNEAEVCTNNEITPDSDTLEFTLTDLEPSTTYEVRVRAKTAAGYGPLGNKIEMKTPDTSESNKLICKQATDANKYHINLAVVCNPSTPSSGIDCPSFEEWKQSFTAVINLSW